MVLVSPESRLLKANSSFCQLLAYSQKELESMTWQDISHPDDLDTGIEQMRRMLTGEIDSCQFEKRYLHKRGHVVWALLSFSLVRDAADRPLHFISQIQDISQRKRVEEELQRAREELEGKVERQLLRRNPYGLTFRELTVLRLVATGESDKEIGAELSISPLTAQKHLSNILAKMSAVARPEPRRRLSQIAAI
jgi:PAS domain S-box-containing protein